MSQATKRCGRGGSVLLLAICILLQAAGSSEALVQTVVASGVNRLVDYTPNVSDPELLWYSIPDCTPPGPGFVGRRDTIPRPRVIGMPGDELSPALISRASLSVSTPRTIFSFNPPRGVAACNPYQLMSNIWGFGPDLYFIDNQGPDGHAALERLPRNANPGDPPQQLADLGSINGGSLIVFGVSVIAIVGDDNGDRIVQYHKDTGELLSAGFEFGDRGTLGNLHFDGRFLYWTNRGALRRDDTFNGDVVTVLNGPIDALYVYGYEEGETPDGPYAYARIVYSQDNSLYEAETLSGSIFPLYTSALANARITAIERDGLHYYFIERRPIGGGFSVDYRFFRLGVGDDVPDLIYGPVDNGGPGFDGFHTDYTWLYFVDRANESLLRIPNDEFAIPVRDLRGTGLEISQGLQDSGNHLRLIAGKRTIVRFYVRSGKAEDVYGVTASLAGSNQNGGFLGRLEPVNSGGKLITVRQNPTRTNLDHSFQFELPPHWTTGGRLSLSATVNLGERIVEDTLENNSASQSVDFTASERLLVIYYNWSYDLGGARRTPNANDVAASRRRMRRLYPLSEPGDAFESPGLHTVVLDFVDNELTDQVDRTDADCVKRYKKADDRNMCASDYVHGRMKALRQGSGIAAGAVSYGNIAQAPAPKGLNYFTRGYANGQFASGPSTDVNYASHEVGHTLGRAHPFRGALKCGHSADDTNYPYGGAYIAETGDAEKEFRYAGLDFADTLPGTMTYLDANSQFDTMAYCTPNWISDYTFEGMYQYLISAGRPRPTVRRGVVAGDWLIISGTLTPAENEGGFVLVQRTNSVMDATPPAPGDFTLELRNSAGGVLASYPFAAGEVEERPGKFVFDMVVGFIPGTAELRVVETASGNELATHPVSANAPLVSDVQLAGAPNPVDGLVTVTWTASDPDDDELRFDVFASRNGDPLYRPIQLGIKETSVALDTTLLGGGTNTLRVVASDGALTAFAESAPFTVPARKPKIVITSPVDGYHADYGQLITLQAEVDDIQDDSVEQISWSTDKGDLIGTGRWVYTDQLPVGQSILTVTATNSLGESASASVTVAIGDVLAPSGPTLSVAPQMVAWHVGGDDATIQTAALTVDNHGTDTLTFNVTSDQSWLLIDSMHAVTDATAPRMFILAVDATMVPDGVTSHATLTFQNADDPNDVVVVPVELSRGNVFDHTGEQGVCSGDCDDDGSVGINELIRAVNIALGWDPLESTCRHASLSIL